MAVRWQRAKRRAGTHSSLTRTMMKRGNTKPFKQKGTGRARQGSKRSPLMRGGAVLFGPTPRSYEFRFPKRSRRLALASVLTEKRVAGKLIVVDSWEAVAGKTQAFVKNLSALGVKNSSACLVTCEDVSETLCKASRNVRKVVAQPAEGMNVYDLVTHDYVIISKDALETVRDRVLGNLGLHDECCGCGEEHAA
jgi:large subunit ribosomal protein L4